MTNFSTSNDAVRVVKQGELDWWVRSGLALVPRAAIKIDSKCPNDIKNYIAWAVEQGYVTLDAYIPEKEYTWEKLSR